AVDIPHLRTRAAGDVDGPRVAQLVRRGDAAGQVPAGALVHVARRGRALVEALGLAGGQLGDAIAVEGDAHASSCMTGADRPGVGVFTGKRSTHGRPGAGSGPKTPAG